MADETLGMGMEKDRHVVLVSLRKKETFLKLRACLFAVVGCKGSMLHSTICSWQSGQPCGLEQATSWAANACKCLQQSPSTDHGNGMLFKSGYTEISMYR